MCVTYAMNKRELERLKRVEQVFNNLKRLKGNIDQKQFLLDVMLSQQVSERKAKEYLNLAKYQYEQWKTNTL